MDQYKISEMQKTELDSISGWGSVVFLTYGLVFKKAVL